MEKKYDPGSLVKARGRDWVVLPSDDDDIVVLKPLGGSEEETTAIYTPLQIPEDKIEPSVFPKPATEDLGDFYTAKLLYNASKLSFRNVSGPFRCMGKLSFRPRSYQVVPLVTALNQDITRLLIADDVGIGKTIEALMILRELMERGEVKRFAVLCLPHLCEQWQQELKDKLDIDAEVIRSGTAAALDRKYTSDAGVFREAPYQVISIDYIKSSRRRDRFVNFCPEMIIVDEAHTCARPAGVENDNAQQRFALLKELSEDPQRHILLLTATPHSGKDEEFTSILGLLNPAFENLDIANIDNKGREAIAPYFIQRKRDNIIKWLGEDTAFPARDSKEVNYKLSPEYREAYKEAFRFARGITAKGIHNQKDRIRYWAALALLRGIMSSPAAGIEMLKNRVEKRTSEIEGMEQTADQLENPVIEKTGQDSDMEQTELLEKIELAQSEIEEIRQLKSRLETLSTPEKDFKVRDTLKIIEKWVKEGYSPIIFCRFISTADYVGKVLRKGLPKSIEVKVITSVLPDEQRREKIDEMGNYTKRVLVATDCLSEGINLQQHFNAVLHYDLPWNPNRLEQREGRVDRFGQQSETVRTFLLWSEDNPIDNIVRNVIIRKVREIQQAIGVSISLGENDLSIMNTILNKVLLDPDLDSKTGAQLTMDFPEAENIITNDIETSKKKAQNIRSIFQHARIKTADIEENLKEVDESIGDPEVVRNFVVQALQWLQVEVRDNGVGYEIAETNLPPFLKAYLRKKYKYGFLVSFVSPTPNNYQYLGRNHKFVEQLCQFILALAFEERQPFGKVARTSVIRTEAVQQLTVLVQFRVRNVIREAKTKNEVIAEEMYLWGFRPGIENDHQEISFNDAKELLMTAQSTENMMKSIQEEYLQDVLNTYQKLEPRFLGLAEDRANQLVNAHGRFKKYTGGKSYEAVHPVLPPDVLGMYVLVPQPVSL